MPRTHRTAPLATLLGTAALWCTALLGAPAPAEAAQPDRSGGPERVATAARIATAAFPDGADNAVVARSDAYPDALAASALAGVLEGPVLLTSGGALSAPTAAVLDDLGVENVYVLGGTRALSAAAEAGLAADHDVARLAGADRYETAARIAREAVQLAGGLGTSEGRTTVLIASGETSADALTASPTAYRSGLPVLLVTRDTLPSATAAALGELRPQAALVLGGEQAVSAAVRDQIAGRGIVVTRVGGLTRLETSERFGAYAAQRLAQTGETVVLARGDTFPDALTGGPLAGGMAAPILLTQSPTVLGVPAERYLAARCGQVSTVHGLGGTAAVSDRVLAAGVAAATDCLGD